jgi:hypothetical protein
VASAPLGAPAGRLLAEAGEEPRDHGTPARLAHRASPTGSDHGLTLALQQPSFCLAISTACPIACSNAPKFGNAVTSWLSLSSTFNASTSAHVEQQRHLVAPRVGPHNQLQHPPRPVPELRPERVFVVAREALHDPLEVETEVIALPVDRQMLGLGQQRPSGGQRPPTPSKNQMIPRVK